MDYLLQPTHLLFVLVVALLVFGPKRLPEMGRSLGRGLRDFKSAVSGEEREEVPAQTAPLTASAAQPAAPAQPTAAASETEPAEQPEHVV